MLSELRRAVRDQADPAKARVLRRFFKTGPGEYGHGDIFFGLTVPKTRALAKKYENLNRPDIARLIKSPIHEERLLALLILASKFKTGSPEQKLWAYETYLNNTKHINNWDLVDLTAGQIVGAFLENRDKTVLYKLAKSEDLWERRIAIIATFCFIRKGSCEHTFAIAEMLLQDEHDLIHKAVGWMLREIGKRIGIRTEERFLKKYYKKMPRTMLRYAIERFPEPRRRAYLKGSVK